MRRALWIVVLTLSACQQEAPTNYADDISDLKTRVAALEQGQKDIVAEVRSAPAPAPVAVAPPRPTYKLEGGTGEPPKYLTRARCEVALQARQDRAAQYAAKMAENGVRVVGGVEYSCIPID